MTFLTSMFGGGVDEDDANKRAEEARRNAEREARDREAAAKAEADEKAREGRRVAASKQGHAGNKRIGLIPNRGDDAPPLQRTVAMTVRG